MMRICPNVYSHPAPGFLLLDGFPPCRELFRTQLGQLKARKLRISGENGIRENFSRGEIPSIRIEVDNITRLYALMTYDQRCALMIFGHRDSANRILVLEWSYRSWMRFSAIPFWEWAFTPENEMVWPPFYTVSLNELSANRPLYAW